LSISKNTAFCCSSLSLVQRSRSFFIGHREASNELLPILTQVVEKHISEYGVTEFIVGGYGSFDHLAARAVISLKQQYPQITLSLLIPYHPAERPIETPPGFDNTYYPPGMEIVPVSLLSFGQIGIWSSMWIS